MKDSMRKMFRLAVVIVCLLSLAAYAAKKSDLNIFNEGDKPPLIKTIIHFFPPMKKIHKPLLHTAEQSDIQGINDAGINCSFDTADELLAYCPSDEDMKQIRQDFNITFDQSLVTHGVLVPWSCQNNGNESSIMLTMYNAFRLMKCIPPFVEGLVWEPEYNNLYDWLKSIELKQITFFWADFGYGSHGWDKKIFIVGNNLEDRMFRETVNPQTGVGLLHLVILVAHEAWHAQTNIGHNCGVGGLLEKTVGKDGGPLKKTVGKDTDLKYGGAWSVQYYLERMLAEYTNNYFNDYSKMTMENNSQDVLNTRFCNQH